MDVLGDRVRRHPADVAQGGDPDDGAGAAPERAAPAVLARLEHPAEQRLFVEPLAVAGDGIVLERVVVVELLRCLDQRDLRIVEIADRPHQQVAVRHVVGVEEAIRSASITVSAWLRLPAFAWVCSRGRGTELPAIVRAVHLGRAPSSRTHVS